MRLFFILASLLTSAAAFAGGFSVSINSLVTASVTGTSTMVMPTDPYRNYLLIQNLGTGSVIVKFGSAQIASEGITIIGGGAYEPIKGIFDSVYMKSSTGTQSVVIMSGE